MTKNNNAQRCFIPASLGFWELGLVDCGCGEYEVDRVPVVAWEMVVDPMSYDDERLYYAHPVTTNPGKTHRGHSPILGPDGCVRVAEETTYPDEASWLKAASAEMNAKLKGAK